MKSEIFVVAFKNAESVKFAALDSRDSLTKSENPTSFKHYFTHEQATSLVKALRAKGLEEGTEVRAKSLAQAVRDYSYKLLLAQASAETTEAETMDKVLGRYKPAAKKAKPAEAETPEAAEAEPVLTEKVAAE